MEWSPLWVVYFRFHSCAAVLSGWLCQTLDCLSLTTPLSMGRSRQEYWCGLPFPSPGDLPDPGMEPVSPVNLALQADSLPAEPSGNHHTERGFFFLVMNFKIYSFGNFQIHSAVLLTVVAKLYIISPWLILHNWKFLLFFFNSFYLFHISPPCLF